jgi:hypothetical protein
MPHRPDSSSDEESVHNNIPSEDDRPKHSKRSRDDEGRHRSSKEKRNKREKKHAPRSSDEEESDAEAKEERRARQEKLRRKQEEMEAQEEAARHAKLSMDAFPELPMEEHKEPPSTPVVVAEPRTQITEVVAVVKEGEEAPKEFPAWDEALRKSVAYHYTKIHADPKQEACNVIWKTYELMGSRPIQQRRVMQPYFIGGERKSTNEEMTPFLKVTSPPMCVVSGCRFPFGSYKDEKTKERNTGEYQNMHDFLPSASFDILLSNEETCAGNNRKIVVDRLSEDKKSIVKTEVSVNVPASEFLASLRRIEEIGVEHICSDPKFEEVPLVIEFHKIKDDQIRMMAADNRDKYQFTKPKGASTYVNSKGEPVTLDMFDAEDQREIRYAALKRVLTTDTLHMSSVFRLDGTKKKKKDDKSVAVPGELKLREAEWTSDPEEIAKEVYGVWTHRPVMQAVRDPKAHKRLMQAEIIRNSRNLSGMLTGAIQLPVADRSDGYVPTPALGYMYNAPIASYSNGKPITLYVEAMVNGKVIVKNQAFELRRGDVVSMTMKLHSKVYKTVHISTEMDSFMLYKRGEFTSESNRNAYADTAQFLPPDSILVGEEEELDLEHGVMDTDGFMKFLEAGDSAQAAAPPSSRPQIEDGLRRHDPTQRASVELAL